MDKKFKNNLSVWEKLIDDHGKWFTVAGNAYVRKKIPAVLFVGDTEGGDVGADLYAHFNSKKQIDSIIIDNDCYFEE